MLWFLVAMPAAIWLVPDFARYGTYRMTDGWLLAHMLILGFASLIAMGASYQLIQVIMRTSLMSKLLGWVHYSLYLIGLLLILLGFGWDGQLIAWGGGCTVTAMLLYGVNIFGTLMLKREWNPFVLGISL